MECLKSDIPFFRRKSFLPKFRKKMLEMSPKQGFSDFLKMSLVFSGNNVK